MRLEHANITVSDIHIATDFLMTALPTMTVRGGGPRANGGAWQHVGDGNTYIAMQHDRQA